MAQRQLELWIEASEQVTTHQSYQLGSRTLTLADLGEIRKMIDYWDTKVASTSRQGRNRVRRVVPRDL
jgi:hypothetical protein